MDNKIPGLHHVTAIASDPQRNLDFYVGLLGLRFVKRTVNFDDPGTYHFYFGDGRGTPGTILTFFPWPGARRGIRGSGQIEATAFAISTDSVGYWLERFKQQHVTGMGRVAAGSVHHIAFRAKDKHEQLQWREHLVDLGYNVTPVIDRTYFHSIYFREPGGVLFEIATEPPVFTLDEKLEELGTHLRLPPWMESARSQIEKILPPIQVPVGVK